MLKLKYVTSRLHVFLLFNIKIVGWSSQSAPTIHVQSCLRVNHVGHAWSDCLVMWCANTFYVTPFSSSKNNCFDKTLYSVAITQSRNILYGLNSNIIEYFPSKNILSINYILSNTCVVHIESCSMLKYAGSGQHFLSLLSYQKRKFGYHRMRLWCKLIRGK